MKKDISSDCSGQVKKLLSSPLAVASLSRTILLVSFLASGSIVVAAWLSTTTTTTIAAGWLSPACDTRSLFFSSSSKTPFSTRKRNCRRFFVLLKADSMDDEEDNTNNDDDDDDDDDDALAVARLFEHLEQQEVEGLHGLQVKRRHGLRGLYTTKEYKAGDYICALPFTSAILIQNELTTTTTTKTTRTTTSFSHQEAKEEHDSSSLLLQQQQQLIREEVDQALCWLKLMDQHRAYVDTLPRVNNDSSLFDATPDFWSDDDLNLIPISRLRETAHQRRDYIAKMASQQQQDNINTTITFEMLQWATWIIRTRGFTTLRVKSFLDDENNKDDNSSRVVQKRTFLLPLLDFMNHRPAGTESASLQVLETPDDDIDSDDCCWEASMFALQATRDIATGEELTITYGTGLESSIDLLDKYGFWLVHNSNKDNSNQQQQQQCQQQQGDFNPANAWIDWSLVENVWKDNNNHDQAERSLLSIQNLNHHGQRTSTTTTKAQQFNRHLAFLYQNRPTLDGSDEEEEEEENY